MKSVLDLFKKFPLNTIHRRQVPIKYFSCFPPAPADSFSNACSFSALVGISFRKHLRDVENLFLHQRMIDVMYTTLLEAYTIFLYQQFYLFNKAKRFCNYYCNVVSACENVS